MTRAELERWRLEQQILENALGRVEQAERAILKGLKCSTDPRELDALLHSDDAARWSARTTDRVMHAKHVLLNIASLRRETGRLDGGSPRVAAYHALLAGIYAGDAATHAVIVAQEQARRQKGGRERGRQKHQAATARDREIAKRARQWHNSDELQEQYGQYRSPVSYITACTGLGARAVQRALARLRTRQ